MSAYLQARTREKRNPRSSGKSLSSCLLGALAVMLVALIGVSAQIDPITGQRPPPASKYRAGAVWSMPNINAHAVAKLRTCKKFCGTLFVNQEIEEFVLGPMRDYDVEIVDSTYSPPELELYSAKLRVVDRIRLNDFNTTEKVLELFRAKRIGKTFPWCKDDQPTDCPIWGADGECDKNPQYMMEHCKRSCGVCGPLAAGHDAELKPEDCAAVKVNEAELAATQAMETGQRSSVDPVPDRPEARQEIERGTAQIQAQMGKPAAPDNIKLYDVAGHDEL